MKRNQEFRRQGWDEAPRGGGHDDRHRDDRPRDDLRSPAGADSPPLTDLLLQAGLWTAGCLAIASTAPAVLVLLLLRELLVICGFVVSVVGLLHGDRLTLHTFNRQDVALLLVALGLVAALFIDPAAVQAYLEAHKRETAAGASG